MTVSGLRGSFERYQVVTYFVAVIVAALTVTLIPGLGMLKAAINPALALMLFATFLQVPLAELGHAFRQRRFMAALLVANFVVIPLIVLLLIRFLPPDPLVRLGVLIVLLAPCIDYVITFSHLGRADARGLLAATPLLLGMQMLLLPVFLGVMLGPDSRNLIRIEPFVHAFVWLIAVPLVLAGLVQYWGRISKLGAQASGLAGLLPVPATALVLFIVICAVVPQLDAAGLSALQVVPIYIGFAVIAPIAGLMVGRLFRLSAPAARALAFSAATRNSLVVLPLALAVPGAVPILPAIIVTQTLIELLSELVYIRLIPKAGRDFTTRQP